MLGGQFEQMLHRAAPKPFASLRDRTGGDACLRARPGQRNLQVLHHFLNRAIPEQPHSDYQPQGSIKRQLSPPHFDLLFTGRPGSECLHEPLRLQMCSKRSKRLGREGKNICDGFWERAH